MSKNLRITWSLLTAFWLPTAIFTVLTSGVYSYFTTVRESAIETAELLENMAIVCEDEGGEFILEYNAEILYIWGECDYNLNEQFEYIPGLPPGEIYNDSL